MTEIQIRMFQIMPLGDSGVGKTTLLNRYIDDSYIPGTAITMAQLRITNVEIEPGVKVKLQIWDIGGVKRLRKMIPLHIPNTDGFLLVFDLTDRESFANIKNEWIPFLPESSPCVLVGHKSDHKHRCVSREEAEELAKELGVSYVEASSVTGHNVKEAFETLVQQIYREKKKQEPQKQETGDDCVRVSLGVGQLFPLLTLMLFIFLEVYYNV
uniref:Uncharacterized protein n=1 Tax=Neogobius melanostomus TaxID=47308 RepID=A0A8C6TMK4_9GOBI